MFQTKPDYETIVGKQRTCIEINPLAGQITILDIVSSVHQIATATSDAYAYQRVLQSYTQCSGLYIAYDILLSGKTRGMRCDE
jgi:hypothetical protein